MKKKILIVNNNMHIGGVQRSLVNLLKCVHDQYDISLVLFHPAGALMEEIPEDIKLIPVRSAYRYLGMTKHDVQGNLPARLMRSFFAAIARLAGRDWAITLMALGQKKLTGYDVAFAFLHDASDKMFYGGCNDFVLRHTNAPIKATLLHCDFMNCGANTPKNAKRYERFDRIAACSEGCRKSFVKALKHLEEKTLTVCNCQDFEFIRQSAEKEPVVLPKDRINLLTVARLGSEKGVPRAIEALSRLPELKPLYHYYIVGDGAERGIVETLIKKYDLENQVTMLGELANPYGYMHAADLLLMPSVNEAAPMVIDEAASLGTPILTTQTTSSDDMVEKSGYGWVCENSIEGICGELQRLLLDQGQIKEKKEFLAKLDLNNDRAMSQFEFLINGNATD